jgi:Ca-activated chloride channel family protein
MSSFIVDHKRKENSMKITTIVSLLLMGVSLNYAQGLILIPERPPQIIMPQMVLRATDISSQIKNGVADVIVEQIFYNPTDARLEGEYLFMIPGEAQVYDFHLFIEGKKVKGELLDGKRAFETYSQIVRTLKDPALMEYAGYGIFKAHIFPIEPKKERKIEFSYVQVLKYEKEQISYSFPLRNGLQANTGKIHLAISLEENSPIGNIYSPTHTIDVSQDHPEGAKISVEMENAEKQQDFKLFYSRSDQDIQHSVLPFRPRTDRDGYFMLLMSPNFNINSDQRLAKDMIFVIDVSGSMQGDKIHQAREALKFCVESLQGEDRFEIISFSSSIRSFKGSLTDANSDNIENARYFIDNLDAAGGTNINGALQKALSVKRQGNGRQTDIIFLTDGLPTEGITDINHILNNVNQQGENGFRIFSFGVGYDVNTYLLDKLSQDSQGRSDYVKPGEVIESAISSLFSKISRPFLTDISLTFNGVEVHDWYPQKISDMYMGERISLIGRYSGNGNMIVRLRGKTGKTTREYQYSITVNKRDLDNEFVAKLWANRKVHHLLTEIRFKGENPELVESIRQLGREYGIITPYTSYLVTEQERELVALDQSIANGDAAVSQSRLQSRQKKRESLAGMDDETVGSGTYYEAMTAIPQAAEKSVGRGAVYSSRALTDLAKNEQAIDMILTVTRVGGYTFNLKNGIWIEQGVSYQELPDRKIEFLSDEYFELLSSDPLLQKILSVGERIKFKWNGSVIQIEMKG